MPVRVEPDLAFVKEVIASGGESVKKCYQCATCSVACPIAPEHSPYPRKEMVWAQWGLKDKLMSDIDVWLCHNCGTCSDLCPRGAKPGDLLAAVRNVTYKKVAGPSFLGEWLSSPKYLPIVAGIPAALYFIIWLIQANRLGTFLPLDNGKVVYGKLFPGDYTIDPIFMIVFFHAMYWFYVGVKNLIKQFSPAGSVMFVGEKKPWWKHLIEYVLDELLVHKKFKDCGDDNSDRKFGHMGVFYAFLALGTVTGIVAVGHWAPVFLNMVGFDLHQLHTPLNQTNPIKLLANVGAIMLICGMGLLTAKRLRKESKKSVSNYYDWYLLGVIWVIALTGVFSQIFRLLNVAVLAYPTYFIHLVSVFMLLAYLPWTKLGHVVYRTAALVYARAMGRTAV